MRRISFDRLFLAAATVLALYLVAATTRWEFEHDTAVMNYLGWLMADRGYLPYRDFTDPALPVSMALYWVVGLAGLGRDPQFLLLGSALAAMAGSLTALALRPVIGRAAWAFVPIYLATLLMPGPSLVMQRDWLAVLFIAPSLTLAIGAAGWRFPVRLFWIGVLFALAAMVKPQYALGAPPVVLMAAALAPGRAGRGAWPIVGKAVGASLLGFAITLAAAAAILAALGILDDLVFWLGDYVPSYLQRTNEHRYLESAAERRAYLLEMMWRFSVERRFVLFFYLSLLFVALLIVFRPPERRKSITALGLAVLTAIYAFVPVLSGQFWNYHYLPFHYFATILVVLLLAADRLFRVGPVLVWLTRAAVIGALALFAARQNVLLSAFWDRPAKSGDVAVYQQAIRDWLPAGGRIQPLAHAEGFYQAMLRERVEVATPYLFDQMFYHDVSTGQTRRFRSAFIAALSADPPEMVAEARRRALPGGRDTSTRFDELAAFLAASYVVVQDDALLRIYLRRDIAPPPGG